MCRKPTPSGVAPETPTPACRRHCRRRTPPDRREYAHKPTKPTGTAPAYAFRTGNAPTKLRTAASYSSFYGRCPPDTATWDRPSTVTVSPRTTATEPYLNFMEVPPLSDPSRLTRIGEPGTSVKKISRGASLPTSRCLLRIGVVCRSYVPLFPFACALGALQPQSNGVESPFFTIKPPQRAFPFSPGYLAGPPRCAYFIYADDRSLNPTTGCRFYPPAAPTGPVRGITPSLFSILRRTRFTSYHLPLNSRNQRFRTRHAAFRRSVQSNVKR